MEIKIQTSYTDAEFRQLIRDELLIILNEVPGMPKIEVNERYLTVSEAADFLNIVKGSLYNMVHQNKVPYHKSGKRVLFKKSELSEWLVTGPVV